MSFDEIKKRLMRFPVFMAVFSLMGMMAAIVISIEKIHLLEDPDAELLCSINPVYSCQSVITSEQASVLGFSNEFIGIGFFGGLLALSLVLISGGTYAKWLHKLTWLGLAGAMIFVLWFFYQSVYTIGALCVYCSIVWFATWSLFVGYTRFLLIKQIVKLPDRYKDAGAIVVRYAPSIWLGLIVLLAALILNHFWYYYGQYF